jgi:hypothetical protein
VKGYGVVSREPILNHAPFVVPDVVLLFDPKLFPLLRTLLREYPPHDPRHIAIIVNTELEPKAFRKVAEFHEPYHLCTLDADRLVRGKRMPPNYALIGGMLGCSAPRRWMPRPSPRWWKLRSPTSSVRARRCAPTSTPCARRASRCWARAPGLPARAALGRVAPNDPPAGQEVQCEEGNRAIARAAAQVLNQFPSVVAAYPITPQTAIVEYLAQMIADGDLTAESVTPESEHGAAGALMGAARDRVLAFTASSSQGLALMAEILHTIGGMRMGNVVISNVVRSLNAPLDVENDHSDLYKVALDAGYLVFMTRDVQQAYDFHLMAWLIGLYAEYRPARLIGPDGRVRRGAIEMIPDRAVMTPVIVGSEGFEVSHAPERYWRSPTRRRARSTPTRPSTTCGRYVFTPNESIMGALQLSNARMGHRLPAPCRHGAGAGGVREGVRQVRRRHRPPLRRGCRPGTSGRRRCSSSPAPRTAPSRRWRASLLQSVSRSACCIPICCAPSRRRSGRS